MVDLSAEMVDLWASLGAPPAGRSRVIQIVAARTGDGASTVARELAHYASRRTGRSVWLVDLDLGGGGQHAAIAAEPDRYGVLSKPTKGSPDGSAFFNVHPPAFTPEGKIWPDGSYLAAHRVGSGRWWVTRFMRERLVGRQSVRPASTADYWRALRGFAEVIIVDGPAMDRSQACVAVAPHMDQTVLVVAADQADIGAPAALRDAISEAGGQVTGLFFNRAVVEPPGFLKALFA
jgi:hypothetical protein